MRDEVEMSTRRSRRRWKEVKNDAHWNNEPPRGSSQRSVRAEREREREGESGGRGRNNTRLRRHQSQSSGTSYCAACTVYRANEGRDWVDRRNAALAFEEIFMHSATGYIRETMAAVLYRRVIRTNADNGNVRDRVDRDRMALAPDARVGLTGRYPECLGGACRVSESSGCGSWQRRRARCRRSR